MKRFFKRAAAVMLPITLALALVLTTVWSGDALLTITDGSRREAGEADPVSFVSTEAESVPEGDGTVGTNSESQPDADDAASVSHREGCALTTEHIAPDECRTQAELDDQSPDSSQAELDAQAAAQVDALILALDELATGTEPNQAAVLEAYRAAQAAFDALTNGAKALVVNADLLAAYARVLGGTGEGSEETPAEDVPTTLEEPVALTAPPANYVRPVTIELAYDDKFENGGQTFKWDENNVDRECSPPYYERFSLSKNGGVPFNFSKDAVYLRWTLDVSRHSLELAKPVTVVLQNTCGVFEIDTTFEEIGTSITGQAYIPMYYLNMTSDDYSYIMVSFCETRDVSKTSSYDTMARLDLGTFTGANSVDMTPYIGVYQTEDKAHTLTIKNDLTVQYDIDKPTDTKISYDACKIGQTGEVISATISANSYSTNRYFLWNKTEQTLTLVRTNKGPIEEADQLVFNRLPAPVELVSGNTKKGYDTLTDAIADAVDGDTITLNADLTENTSIDQAVKLTINGNGHTLTAANGNAITVNADGVDLSINQLNIEAKGTGGRGIHVENKNAASFKLTECNLLVNQRGISYNGSVGETSVLTDIKVELDNTTIKNSQISNYETDTKIDGTCRGISLFDVKESTVILKNHSAIQGFGYCINVSATKDENGVADTQGLVVTVEDSELFGWTGFNVWGSQATYNITRSKILGINTSNGSSNSFSAITFNDDIYEQFGDAHAVNNVLNITDSTITNYQSASCTEELLRIDCGITQLNLYGNVKFVDTTGNIAAALYLSHMQDYEAFLKNNVHIYGTVESNRLIKGQSSEMPFAPTLLGINTYVNNGKTLQSYVFDFASFIPGIDYDKATANQEKLILYTDVNASTFAINGEPGHGNEFGGWTLDLNGHNLTVEEWTADKVTVIDSVGGGQIIVGGKPVLVAANGDNRYPTIQAAVEAAKNGDTITINADVILSGPVTINKPITLKDDGTHKITVGYSEAVKDGQSPFKITESGVTLEGLNVELTVDTFNIIHFNGKRVNVKYCTFTAVNGKAIRKAFNSIGGGSQLTGNTVVSGSKTFTDGSKTGLLSVRTTAPDVTVGTILIQENTFEGFYKGISVDNNAAKVPVLVSQNKFVRVDYPFEASAETASCLALAYNYSDGAAPKLKDDSADRELTGDNLPSVYPYYTDAALTALKTGSDPSADQSLTALAEETVTEVKEAISNMNSENLNDAEKTKINDAVEDITSLPNNTLTTSAAKDTVAALEELYIAANENVIKTEVTVNDSVSTLPDAETKASVTGAALSVPADAVSKVKAKLVIEPAEEPATLPIDKPADAAVIPLEITLNIVKEGGVVLQEAIQPRAPIVVTLPIPAGVKPDNIVILHYHANSLPATIYPIVDKTRGTMTFTVTKLSTFVVTNYVRKASPSPSSPSYGSGYYDEYLNTTNYWDGMIDSISGIGNGGAIIANAPNYTLVPTRVLQYLKGKNITLTLRLADGSISINGAKMGEVHSDWVYYTFEDLKNEFSDAAPDGSVPAPETPTPSVTAPSITYPELGNESPAPEETIATETPETPNAPQTSDPDQKKEQPDDDAKPAESPAVPQEVSSGISPWAVAAIAAACLILIGLIVFFVLRARRRR